MSRIDLVHSGHSRRPSRGLLSAAVRAAGPWPGCRPGCGPASGTGSQTRRCSACGRRAPAPPSGAGQQLRHHNANPGPPGPVMSAPNPLSNAYSANSIGAKCAFGRLTPGRGLAGRLFPEVSAGRLFPGGAAARESREWPAGSGGRSWIFDPTPMRSAIQDLLAAPPAGPLRDHHSHYRHQRHNRPLGA